MAKKSASTKKETTIAVSETVSSPPQFDNVSPMSLFELVPYQKIQRDCIISPKFVILSKKHGIKNIALVRKNL